MTKRRKTVIDKKKISHIDPMLGKPTDDIEQNLAEGIDEMIPDSDDIPGGVKPDLTPMPDLEEVDAQAYLSKKGTLGTSPKRKPKGK